MEVFAEAAGVVVEDGLGISKTFQNWKHFHRLEGAKRTMAEVGVSAITCPALKKTNETLIICEHREYLRQTLVSAFVQEAEVANDQLGGFSLP